MESDFHSRAMMQQKKQNKTIQNKTKQKKKKTSERSEQVSFFFFFAASHFHGMISYFIHTEIFFSVTDKFLRLEAIGCPPLWSTIIFTSD